MSTVDSQLIRRKCYLGDVPDLWGPGRGRQLMALLRRWDEEEPDRRDEPTGQIRTHLRSLQEGDVPPLI